MYSTQPLRPMRNPSRRAFLKTAVVGGSALAWGARSWAQVAGVNQEVRVAVIGLNNRGKNHLAALRVVPGVRIVALCDVDSAVLEQAAADLGKLGITGEKFTDVRRLLASPAIDAVTIATPNHWHALAAIWACEAGKDVYVEKPVSHNLWEGRQLVAAAAKYNRVVQAGVQIRSGEGLREAVQWVRAGNLGPIKVSRGFCYKRRKSIGRSTGPHLPPPTVDYDLWLGPAPEEAPRRARFHYDWHWFNAYGNGDVGNQGIHQMDVARWFLGDPGLPRQTLSLGGRLGYVDDGETPNTQIVWHDYAEAPLIFEVRGLPAVFDPKENEVGAVGAEAAGALAKTMDRYRGVAVGNIVDCEGGSVVSTGYFNATAYDRDGKVMREFTGQDRLMQNFIDVVRSRKTAELYGPINQGHLSSALCHLGGISHQLGRAASAEEMNERVKADPAFAETYARLAAHLAANQIDLDRSPVKLGRHLVIDGTNERFTGEGAASANALLTRQYRAGYAVPQLA
jgi:predicted dehydrogenase